LKQLVCSLIVAIVGIDITAHAIECYGLHKKRLLWSFEFPNILSVILPYSTVEAHNVDNEMVLRVSMKRNGLLQFKEIWMQFKDSNELSLALGVLQENRRLAHPSTEHPRTSSLLVERIEEQDLAAHANQVGGLQGFVGRMVGAPSRNDVIGTLGCKGSLAGLLGCGPGRLK
jgi:hypothetical protein